MGIGRRLTGALAGLLAVVLTLCLAGVAWAGLNSKSLPKKEGTAARPGPEVLYQRLASSPQLENAPHSPWHAKPVLISGASAYRKGEFVYQGYLYDDHGAKETTDPTDPQTKGDEFSKPNGTYTYPTGPGYDENAADLTELRVKPRHKATLFRISLNTLENPNLIATGIAIGGSEGVNHPFPFGANVSAPAQYFLTVHGNTAVLTNAETGAVVPGPAPAVKVDLLRRQITVSVRHSEWNPGSSTVRLAAGVGLWDSETESYLLPGATATETKPGGAGEAANPPAFFDVAFRFNDQEPVPATSSESEVNPSYWRDSAQAQELAKGEISSFHAEVDFARLRARQTDEMAGEPTGVPQSGVFDRIMASHYSNGQGTDWADTCESEISCNGEIRGQLQPYAVYVPAGPAPRSGWGLTLLLHSLDANYNQFAGTKNQSEFGNRGAGSIVITPSGRGPDGWYYDHAGANTFETWADTAARYHLNAAFSDIAGYSMGGYGTYKLATQFPDLFGRAQPTVGPPGLGIWTPPAPPSGGEASLTQRMLGSVRNVPFMIWDETSDELVPIAGVREQVKTFESLGYRYVFDEFHEGDHLTLAINDEYQPAAEFLGTETVNRNPAHVTYVYNPTMDFPADGTSAGHAYWVYGVTLREAGGSAPLGSVDVRSEGFGVGDPTASATEVGAGVLAGGTLGALPYTSETKTWGPAPAEPKHDALAIRATNVSAFTVDARRAKVNCSATLNVTTDGPLTVTLADCPGGATVSRSFG